MAATATTVVEYRLFCISVQAMNLACELPLVIQALFYCPTTKCMKKDAGFMFCVEKKALIMILDVNISRELKKRKVY